jgi:nicotinate-nucleotide pyrophosphorylase (carboxylating)
MLCYSACPRSSSSTRSLLVAERLVLNLMQRMSGIATATALYVRTMNSSHTRLLDTRKTAPGLRLLDKAAVRHGGGVNHRLGLDDMVLIKDNHIEAAGGIANAVRAARAFLVGRGAEGEQVQVEVEARTLDEVREVLELGDHVDRILLDNMVKIDADKKVDTTVLQQALELINAAAASSSRKLLTEASGNVNLQTIGTIGQTGVDYVSVGALTHSVTALDISMKIKLEQ